MNDDNESGESLPELPPLDLGLRGPDDPPAGQPMDDDGPDGRNHWRWWLALGMALVAGATAGAIGANACNDAMDRNEIMLVAGEVAAEELADGASSLVGFGVYNASEFSVKIESFEVDGWTRTGATELVTVAPGTWARLEMNAEPDCDSQGDLVRAGGGGPYHRPGHHACATSAFRRRGDPRRVGSPLYGRRG